MKIRSLFLIAIFALFSTSSFAKDHKAAPKKDVKVAESKKDQIEDMQIQPFDFQKLFAEAEKNFQIAKAWKKIKCQPKSGFLCTKHECVKKEVKTYLVLDKEKETITRCDSETCESFEAKFNQTGVFFNIQSDGPVGTLIRIFGDSRYKEITTVGLDAYIANGNCEVVAE